MMNGRNLHCQQVEIDQSENKPTGESNSSPTNQLNVPVRTRVNVNTLATVVPTGNNKQTKEIDTKQIGTERDANRVLLPITPSQPLLFVSLCLSVSRQTLSNNAATTACCNYN